MAKQTLSEFSNGIDLMINEVRHFFLAVESSYVQIKKQFPEYQSVYFENNCFDGGINLQFNGYTLIAQYGLPKNRSVTGSFLSVGIYNQLVNNSGFILANGLPEAIDISLNQIEHCQYELFLDEDDNPVWLDIQKQEQDEEWETDELVRIWISKLLMPSS